MGSDESVVAHIAEQIALPDRLTYKKMFGEYGLYVDGVFVAMVCDNSLFLKPTAALDALGIDPPMRVPYPRGKPHPVVDELIDDPDRLRRLLIDTAGILGPSKRKRS